MKNYMTPIVNMINIVDVVATSAPLDVYNFEVGAGFNVADATEVFGKYFIS